VWKQEKVYLFKTSDVFPAYVRHLHNIFSERGRIGYAESMLEVLPGNLNRVQNGGVNGLFVHVDQVKLLSNRLESSFHTQLRQIGSDIAMRILGDLLEIALLR